MDIQEGRVKFERRTAEYKYLDTDVLIKPLSVWRINVSTDARGLAEQSARGRYKDTSVLHYTPLHRFAQTQFGPITSWHTIKREKLIRVKYRVVARTE